MQFELRIPVGILFSLYGVLLTLYGMFSDSTQYERSLGLNINLGWVPVLIVFGAILLLARRNR